VKSSKSGRPTKPGPLVFLGREISSITGYETEMNWKRRLPILDSIPSGNYFAAERRSGTGGHLALINLSGGQVPPKVSWKL
jgi:hypothetical protein